MSGDDTLRTRPSRPFVAASLICVRDGRALLARRGAAPMRGVWSAPGGMIELGETAAEAALRELTEETGVSAHIAGLIDVVDVILKADDGAVERHVTILAFAGRWRAGDGVPGPEALEVGWFAPDALAALETTPGLGPLVAAAVERAG